MNTGGVARKLVSTIAVGIIAALVATISPASAEEEAPRGFGPSVACVAPQAGGTQGWQIGAGIRYWNAAQPYVHLTREDLGPACGVIHVVTYWSSPTDPNGSAAGLTTFSGWGEGAPGAGGGWFYPSVTVGFNDYTRSRMRTVDNLKCYKKMAVIHEMGHALGLTHSDDPTSIMYTHDRSFSRCLLDPSPADRASLDRIYALR